MLSFSPSPAGYHRPLSSAELQLWAPWLFTCSCIGWHLCGIVLTTGTGQWSQQLELVHVSIELVMARTSIELVTARTSIELVMARTSIELVMARTSIELIMARTSIELIMARTSIELIMARTSIELIMARAECHQNRLLLSRQEVVVISFCPWLRKLPDDAPLLVEADASPLLPACPPNPSLVSSAQCLCGEADQTPEHYLQSCSLYHQARRQIWPTCVSLKTKLWGSAEDLFLTSKYAALTGERI